MALSCSVSFAVHASLGHSYCKKRQEQTGITQWSSAIAEAFAQASLSNLFYGHQTSTWHPVSAVSGGRSWCGWHHLYQRQRIGRQFLFAYFWSVFFNQAIWICTCLIFVKINTGLCLTIHLGTGSGPECGSLLVVRHGLSLECLQSKLLCWLISGFRAEFILFYSFFFFSLSHIILAINGTGLTFFFQGCCLISLLGFSKQESQLLRLLTRWSWTSLWISAIYFLRWW